MLVLASAGTRALETCAIRLRDIDFFTRPTKIHIRKEYAKTRVSRDIYISDEASKYLKDWINFKYNDNTNKLYENENIPAAATATAPNFTYEKSNSLEGN